MNVESGYRQPSEDSIREAVDRLAQWEGLSRSERLRGLLEHIVDQSLAGRGDAIKAKTIGMDLYGYSVKELELRESVVRVDVGRLRRKLQEYYDSDGSEDPVRIILNKGAYAPIFTEVQDYDDLVADTVTPPLSSWPKARWLFAVGGVTAALVAILFVWPEYGSANLTDSVASDVERTAMFFASPNRLRALNLAEEGRDLIFPAASPGQLATALGTFDAAIEADPNYAGGYAGAAQVNALIAAVSLDDERIARSIDVAESLANRALELAPGEAWSQSAAAFTRFADGDFDRAIELSQRAMGIAPNDPHILEFDALISLYTGNFERVVSESVRMERLAPASRDHVFWNAYGAAHYHLGRYQQAIDTFEASIASGGPIGPPSLAYLIAAHQRIGNVVRAAELVSVYEASFPAIRIDLIKTRLFRDPKHADDLIAAMIEAGWSLR